MSNIIDLNKYKKAKKALESDKKPEDKGTLTVILPPGVPPITAAELVKLIEEEIRKELNDE